MYETAHDILSLTYDKVSAQDMCAQEPPRRLAESALYWQCPRPSDCWHGFCSPRRRYGIVGEFPVIARAEQPFDQPSYALPPAAVVAHLARILCEGSRVRKPSDVLPLQDPTNSLLQHGYQRGGYF